MEQSIWRPSEARIRNANITRFLERVRADGNPVIESYRDLWQWSVDQPAAFWRHIRDFCGLQLQREPDAVMTPADHIRDTRFFPGARLNFAENLLRFDDDRPALVFRNEAGDRLVWTYADLHRETARIAAGLRADGVEAGDRVAGLLPNRPETVAAMLAATSIGAIWTSCSPDFAEAAIVDRFSQVEPRVLFVSDGYVFKGRTFDVRDTARRLTERIGSIRRTVWVPYAGLDTTGGVAYADYGEPGAELVFEPQPFDHPVYILYSSGTTGAPKCIVHGAGGTLLQHLKEHVLHTDIGRDDRVFFFTTCGWMMWNWLVSGLATGARLVLFDGQPFYPDAGVLPRMAAEEGITVFGASAGYYGALEKTGAEPGREHDLSALKTVLSTGSPLMPESFDYIYRAVHADVCLASISGGTDIVACFALGNPALPVYRGELQCRALGMRTEVFDEDGNPIREDKGELVCTAPFPSMPVKFWNDPDGARYHRAYFERFSNVWHHGDYAMLTERDGLVIYGRSDAVLNPGGVRIGTAEIYRPVKQLPEVVECVAVGQAWKGDTRVVLFVQLDDGIPLDDALRDRIRRTIRENASPRHVPAKILAVSDIPRTRNAKLAEIAVRQAVHGEEIGNTAALANPEAVAEFRNRWELEGS